MKIKTFIILFIFTVLTSCSFNKLFLRPTKLPANTKKIKIKSGNDTIVVQFDTITYKPTFLKTNNDTLQHDFTIESVSFTSANGHKLNGWFLKPKNIKPQITILHLHGNAGFLVSQYKAIAGLTKYGFQIFMFDYSGFGFSEGKATKKNVLTDALSALDYLKTRNDIKNTKLIIYGQSLGGHLSAVVAEKRQNDIDGLVIESAFSSHKDIAANMAGIIGRIFVNEKYSAIESIKNYKKPLLVIHSTEDKTVPFYMGQKIYETANQPKDFFKIKHRHISGVIYYSKQISQKIKKMLGLV